MLAALASWALAAPGVADPGAAFRVLQFLPFLLGGPGWAAFFGLLMFGASRGIKDLAPQWLQWSGYVLSVTSLLATLVLLTLMAAPFLPLSRFLGFIWLIVTAAFLTRRGAAAQLAAL